MKSKLLALAALILGISSLNAAEAFLRPTAYLVVPTMSGFSDAAAGGLSGGVLFGSERQHEISLEWCYTYWDAHYSNRYASATDRQHIMPWYVNYRYIANTSFSNVRVYIGPALGFTYFLAESNASSSYYHSSSYSYTYDLKPTVSGSVGAIVELTRHLDLDLGYRYLYSKAPSDGFFADDTIGLHLFYAGLNCRF